MNSAGDGGPQWDALHGDLSTRGHSPAVNETLEISDYKHATVNDERN